MKDWNRFNIRDSSREKFYQELSLESLQQQLWYWKICLFFKINQSPKYLLELKPTATISQKVFCKK